MSHCTKNIVLIFGILLLLAVLIVPYNSSHISFELDSRSKNVLKVTQNKSGYIFLPKYLILRARMDSDEETRDFYHLNTFFLTAEIVLILFLGFLDYFLFCRFLRKRRKMEEKT
ncbi:MAG: hypothetical protein PVF66_12760 [Candidatus Aminicenantes bacterium]|jgi:hypothetical protein